MPIHIKCPSCKTTLKVADSVAGKNVRCPKCQTVLACPAATARVLPARAKTTSAKKPTLANRSSTKKPPAGRPTKASSSPPIVQDTAANDPFNFDSIPLGSAASDGSPPTASGYYSHPQTSSGGTPIRVLWIVAAGILGTGLFVIACGFFVYFFTSSQAGIGPTQAQVPPGGRNAIQNSSGNNTNSGLDMFSYSPPPRMPAPHVSVQALPPSADARLLEIDLGKHNNAGAPGFQTQIRIYKPNAATQAGSSICVLVGPAGTPLLHGTELGLGNDNDYHDEALPYVQKGMIVVQFSLDGWMPEAESLASEAAQLERLSEEMVKFVGAHAGTTNARIALDYALKHVPEIDPNRIYVAGHSSAGTLALQMATAEPRLAGALAYAPVADLSKRLGDLLSEPSIAVQLPSLSGYLARYSPAKLKPACPLFVFAAKNDQNEPFRDTQIYVSRIRSQVPRGDATFSETATGGHYQSMIDDGIPRGIQWILSRS